MKTIKHFPIVLLCLTMLISVSACNSDYEETPAPQTSMDDASLLESQMKYIKAKAADATIAIMVTTKKEISLSVQQTSSIIINWGDLSKEVIPMENSWQRIAHTYTDNSPVHTISFYGTGNALTGLRYYNQELIFLDVTKSPDLVELGCSINNRLSQLDVSQNTKLSILQIGNNLMPSIDLTQNVLLTQLDCSGCTLLTTLSLSGNHQLSYLNCDNSSLTSLNLSQCDSINSISCDGTPFASDFDESLNMLISLPNRNGKTEGYIYYLNCPDQALLVPIAARKNWTIY